jgi:hypothetical protein
MARVKRAGRDDWFRVGVHVVAPNKKKLEDAKDDADRGGYPTVWVHPRGSLKTVKKR